MRRLARWFVRTAAGRRLLLALALLAVWFGWTIAPPRPLREWTTASAEPYDWLVTPDGTRLAWVAWRQVQWPHLHMSPPIVEYGPLRLWDLATGREAPAVGDNGPTNTPVTLRATPDGAGLLVTRRVDDANEVALQLWDPATGRQRWSTLIATTARTEPHAN